MQCRTWAPCPLTRQEVCGTDGKTYTNDCFLRKQTCLSGGLTKLKYRGPCGKLNCVSGTFFASESLGIIHLVRMQNFLKN